MTRKDGRGEDGKTAVAVNRKARHDFHIEETYEAGIVLTGTEVKSLRAGHCSLRDSYAEARGGELFLVNAHIPQYKQGNRFNHEPLRDRKLLMHKMEIRRLGQKAREKGYTLVPLRVYFSGPRAKVEIALARGKREYDKRQAIADRDARRSMERTLAARSGRES
ncbi:MAG: SsrA-binding protein SmpB [Bacillota bacterium]|nr:MAG: SsrA-binding protein SmpB [Bacillota bacterium]